MLDGFKRDPRHDAKETLGHHFDNLYDQNEDQAGNLIDPATGLRINNSTNVDSADESFTIREPSSHSEDVLGAIPSEKDDMAADFFKSLGLDENGNPISEDGDKDAL